MDEQRLSLNEVATRAGVTPATLKRWVDRGIIPDGKKVTKHGWTPAAAAHARTVARLRDRGHSFDEIEAATKDGRLAAGLLEDLFPPGERVYTIEDVARETELEPELIERIWVTMGFSPRELDALTEQDVQAL